jgi:hypothetical protein
MHTMYGIANKNNLKYVAAKLTSMPEEGET